MTTNDSGDSGRVFVVDGSGATVGVTALVGRAARTSRRSRRERPTRCGSATSATTAGCATRSEITPVPVGARDIDVDAPSYELVYPDGARDAETLMSDPTTGRLYVATKEIFGGLLYEVPEQPRPRQAEPAA